MTPAERRHQIDQIRHLPDRLAALVNELTVEQLTTPYLPHEWTVAQNIHHLADAHMNGYIRMKLVVTEAQPILKPYDQDGWAQQPDANAAEVASSLTLLHCLHGRWVQWLETVPQPVWARTGHHLTAGVVSLDDLLQTYGLHGEAHLDQIRRTLAAQPSV